MSDPVNYEWDEKKRISNLAKHGVDFADAAIFQWETARIGEDPRHDELRYTALGYLGDRLHAVAFTVREGCIRLISFRKAIAFRVSSESRHAMKCALLARFMVQIKSEML